MYSKNTKVIQFTNYSKEKILINVIIVNYYLKMNADVIEARKLYADLRKSPTTHVIQTTEIATACECQNLFKISNLYGVFRGDRDYLIGNTVHDILSLILAGP